MKTKSDRPQGLNIHKRMEKKWEMTVDMWVSDHLVRIYQGKY